MRFQKFLARNTEFSLFDCLVQKDTKVYKRKKIIYINSNNFITHLPRENRLSAKKINKCFTSVHCTHSTEKIQEVNSNVVKF